MGVHTSSMARPDREELLIQKSVRPDDWQSRIGGTFITSALIGCGVGAVEAFWADVPAVKKEAAIPALRATAGVISRNALFFGAVGGTFAAGDHIARSFRDKSDAWNGFYGGLAAGAVVAVKANKPLLGVGAGLAFGAIAMCCDLSGQTLQPTRFADPKRTFHYGHAKE